MSYLSRKDLDELKPSVEKAVFKIVGENESHLVNKCLDCLDANYDRRKTVDKLTSYLDSKKASRLADKLFDLLDDLKYRSKKRPHDDREHDQKRHKSSSGGKHEQGDEKSDSKKLSTSKIKEIMATAQKQIENKKSAAAAIAKVVIPPANIYGIPQDIVSRDASDKARKIAQLQAQIKNKLASGVLGNVIAQLPPPDKPTPLILDSEGRTIDKSGKAVQLTQLVPTLKANIRAQKRDQFNRFNSSSGPGAGGSVELASGGTPAVDGGEQRHRGIGRAGVAAATTTTSFSAGFAVSGAATTTTSDATNFFDPRIGSKPAMRNKRALRFHEPGKFQQLADRLRMKAQLEKLQNEISQIAKKTGISSATKLALIAKSEGLSEEVPEMEWWDSVILVDNLDTLDSESKIVIKKEVITNLVEHPTQMRCPTDPLRPVYMPVFLTKTERKKLRRQNRREAWKEEQEKIRLGLEAAPEPKLRISNLMRALGTEAVQDPTKIEAHVREQMAKRQKAHEEANASRQLSVEQRREKKIRKMREDTSLGVYVAVYRVRALQDLQAKRFKVETNARQLQMTGCALLYPDCCVVVVEGGPRQQRKYKRLMLERIKWEEDVVKDPDGRDVPNKCTLVWEGTSKQRNFGGEMKVKVTPLEKLAREHFKKHKVEHYWDLAYSGAVLEPALDSVNAA